MTAQVGDRIFFRGQECALFSCPLRDYKNTQHPLPPFVSPHTANWRGYVATWAVEDNVLLLTDIVGWVEGHRQVGWEGVFPHRQQPIRADWFSGDLRIPQGERLQYVHMGFGSTYAQDLLLAIHRGQVVLCDLHENGVEPRQRRGRSRLVRSELLTRPADLFADAEWAFLSAVHADREDTGQLLVYSDWLTDQGDVRGDYLRLRVPLLGRSDAEMQAHPHASQLAEMEREHLEGCVWWLRLLGLVPVGDALLAWDRRPLFAEWQEATSRRSLRD